MFALLVGCNAVSGVGDLLIDGDGGGPPIDASPEGSSTGNPPPPPPPAGDGGGSDAANDAVEEFVPFDGGDAASSFIVFVTSTSTNGAIGGLGNADILCQARATSAGLAGPFVAWLSSGATTAPSRITAAGPWFLTTGELAVDKFELVTLSTLMRPIARDENKNLVSDEAWTGTSNTGPSGNDCNGWTSNLSTVGGTVGSTGATGSGWTNKRAIACANSRRLYCFQN